MHCRPIVLYMHIVFFYSVCTQVYLYLCQSDFIWMFRIFHALFVEWCWCSFTFFLLFVLYAFLFVSLCLETLSCRVQPLFNILVLCVQLMFDGSIESLSINSIQFNSIILSRGWILNIESRLIFYRKNGRPDSYIQLFQTNSCVISEPQRDSIFKIHAAVSGCEMIR